MTDYGLGKFGENVVGALGFESSNVKPCCALDFGASLLWMLLNPLEQNQTIIMNIPSLKLELHQI